MREIRTYGSVGALGVVSHPGPPDSRNRTILTSRRRFGYACGLSISTLDKHATGTHSLHASVQLASVDVAEAG